ncbi:hypothetical protein [Aeromicrobium sp.]|uniref:hypothetical protein n=1 Tax=Aeromicrobium sp. TaxID=1871063 RepID=UPI00199DFD27|nr:hypothetical protein [Aeromicrobium sp.]MBC7630245.1 hypothetical protein [Aeromicrobium sp.]
MTSSSPQARVRTILSRLGLSRLGLSRLSLTRLVVPATVILVVVGLIAVMTDHTRWAVAAVLLLQAVVVLAVLDQRGAVPESERRIAQRVDQASARTLADLSRVRQQLLAALDETRTKD